MLVFEEMRLLTVLLKKFFIKTSKQTNKQQQKNPKKTDGHMPFSDLKPFYCHLCIPDLANEWDETVLVSNKFHEILPKLL